MGLEPQPIETRGRTRTTDSEKRLAAINVADRIGREHPTNSDEALPKYAGRTVARDPQARTALLQLLEALGLDHDDIRRTA